MEKLREYEMSKYRDLMAQKGINIYDLKERYRALYGEINQLEETYQRLNRNRGQQLATRIEFGKSKSKKIKKRKSRPKNTKRRRSRDRF